MSAALRLALVWTMVTAIAGLQSCTSTRPSAPQPLAAAVHALNIAPVVRGDGVSFVVCADCPSPTAKSFGSPTPVRSLSADGVVPPERLPATQPPARIEPPAVRIRTERFTLMFELGSAELSRQSRQVLSALTPLAQSAIRVRISGFTDDLGSRELNARLSSARALGAMRHLRDALKEPYPGLTATARPHCCYLTDNQGEDQRAPNRRVEIDVDLEDSARTSRLVIAAQIAIAGVAGTSAQRNGPGDGSAVTAGKRMEQARSAR